LIYGKTVEISYEKLDRYGRVLGLITCGGKDINLAQVEAGLAWWYREYQREQTPEQRRAYEAAEERARADRRGLWQQPNPVKPSDYRHARND
jgi:endonuclease YncB( thermonuclease family)